MDEFQKQALKSIAITQKGPAALAHRMLGLTGEMGILANQLKKVIRDKDSIADTEDIAVIQKRLGDILYYTATLAAYFDLNLSVVAQQNVQQSAAFAKDRSNTN